MDFKGLNEIFNNSRKIVITTHLIPDGDAIGSSLALYYFLKNKGKEVYLINHSPTPPNLKFLDRENIISVFCEDEEKNTFVILDADLVCIVDTNEYSRIKSMEEVVRKAKAKKVCIDHHQGLIPENYDFALCDTSYPATAQLLYDFFTNIPGNSIDTRIAENLYTGILTDTGSFRYPRTTSRTFRIAADLVDKGADPIMTYEEVYSNNTISKLKLMSSFIGGLEFYENNTIGVGIVTMKDFEKYDADVTDIEGFTSVIMSIENISIGILLVELKNSIKVSFRSKGEIQMNELAKKFGGGGHKNASGASVPKQDTFLLKEKIISEAKHYLTGKEKINQI